MPTSPSSPQTDGPLPADEALVARMARGDERALAALYDRYGATAYDLARAITDDRADAERAVEEAFLAVWRRAAPLGVERASASAWLLALVRRHALDLRQARHANPAARGGRITDAGPRADVDDPRAGRREAVRGALAALSEEERRAIELAYFDGLTTRAIAAALAQPEEVVHHRLRSSMRSLRAALVPARAGTRPRAAATSAESTELAR